MFYSQRISNEAAREVVPKISAWGYKITRPKRHQAISDSDLGTVIERSYRFMELDEIDRHVLYERLRSYLPATKPEVEGSLSQYRPK